MARETEPGSSAPRVGTTSVGLLYLFLAFQLVDQIFLPILVATFILAKSVKRHPTVVNVCVTWIISGIISSLLLYAGKHVGPEPPKMLCMSQASLLNGVLPMTSVAVLGLMYQVNYSIRNLNAQEYGAFSYALIIAPYITLFCFATAAAIAVVQKPDSVSRARRFFYCSFQSPISNVFAVFSSLALFTALGYAVGIGLFVRRNWNTLRQASNLIDLHSLMRVGVFGIYIFLAVILSLLSIIAPRSPFPDIFAASIGTALFIILSSQPDVLRAWLRRARPVPPRVTDNWIHLDMPEAQVDKKISTSLGDEEIASGSVDIGARLTALQHASRWSSWSGNKFIVGHNAGGEKAAPSQNYSAAGK